MAKKPTRTGVPIELPNTQLRQVNQQADTFAPINNTQKVGTSSFGRAMQALSDAIPAFSSFQATLDKEIEKDKTIQQNRAELGQEPSEDATEEGIQASNAVKLRNKTHIIIGNLRERLNNFDGSDEEYEEIISSAQGEVLDLAGDDKTLIQAGAELFRQYLPQINQTRGKAKEELRQVELQEVNSENLIMATTGNYTPEQLRNNVAKVLTEMDLQGMTAASVEKTLIDTAAIQASQKDLTLLDWVKEQKPEWYNNSPKLIEAEKSAQRELFMDSQGQAAQMKEDIETKYKTTPSMTKEQWFREGGALQLYDTPLYSDEQLLAVWRGIEKGRDKEFTTDLYFQQLITLSENPSADPVSFLGSKPMTKEQQLTVIDRLDKYQEAQLVEFSKLTEDDDEISVFMDKQVAFKAKLLAGSDLQDPSWTKQFNAVGQLGYENLRPGVDKLPVGVKNALTTMDSLSEFPSALSAHASDKAIVLSKAYHDNLKSDMDEVSAYQLAYKIANTKVSLDKETRDSINSKVSESMEDYNHITFFSGIEDIPTEQLGVLSNGIRERVSSLVSQNMPIDDAVAMAKKEFSESTFQLPNGKLVMGKLPRIAQVSGMSQERTLEMISNLPERISEDFDVDDDFVLDPYTETSDWYPVIKPNGTIYFTDVSGTIPITKPMTLEQAAGKTKEQLVKEAEERDKSIREYREKQATEGRYWPSIYTEKVKNPYSKWEQ